MGTLQGPSPGRLRRRALQSVPPDVPKGRNLLRRSVIAGIAALLAAVPLGLGVPGSAPSAAAAGASIDDRLLQPVDGFGATQVDMSARAIALASENVPGTTPESAAQGITGTADAVAAAGGTDRFTSSSAPPVEPPCEVDHGKDHAIEPRHADLTASFAMINSGGCEVAKSPGRSASTDVQQQLQMSSAPTTFDAGAIISDAVFYDVEAMTDPEIDTFLASQGEACRGGYCLKDLRIATTDQPADRYCSAYVGGPAESAAAVIGKVSRACGVNPQVMLVTLQKESGLLDRTDPTSQTYYAAWGWHCPDTGPGGTAHCDPAYAGFFHQAYGMAKQWARYRLDPGRYHYHAGQRADILWNVEESGCGGAPVTIENTATASLYNYTPYQPNAASLAAYPSRGDACSSYGNRNFFFLFHRYFSAGSGGALSRPALFGTAGIGTPASVVIPANRFVDPAVAGRTVTVAGVAVARGLQAGFDALGTPYVWGGGGSGAGPDNGCRRGGGQYNSCGTEIGFDCSGLTAYVMAHAGRSIPGDSAGQRGSGVPIPWSQALPGDIVGFPGHVAVYLGLVERERYILEASWVGYPVHIVRLTRHDADPVLHRYWAGGPDTEFGALVIGRSRLPSQGAMHPSVGVSREGGAPQNVPPLPAGRHGGADAVPTRLAPAPSASPRMNKHPTTSVSTTTAVPIRTTDPADGTPATSPTTAAVTTRSTTSGTPPPVSGAQSTGTRTMTPQSATTPSSATFSATPGTGGLATSPVANSTETTAPGRTSPDITAPDVTTPGSARGSTSPESTPGTTAPAETRTDPTSGGPAPAASTIQAPPTTSTLPAPTVPTEPATVPTDVTTVLPASSGAVGCAAGAAEPSAQPAANSLAGPPSIAPPVTVAAPTAFAQAIVTLSAVPAATPECGSTNETGI